MAEQTAVHTFDLPMEEATYRCGGCNRVWSRSPISDKWAILLYHKKNDLGYTQRVDDGYFHCCDRQFRWASS